ncbi:hypothetical protein EDD37DRAFT_607833 [Exophiala viscosa]|uniref:uncharacterized protein n=1 Tax=Exophiala viscosa TaxID=2486360 RepID=UPI00218DCE0D|nr:hypothetical protein EDD37DRAFT_607833 [Exophiala viscosa]
MKSVTWADLPPTGAQIQKLEDENCGLRARVDDLNDELARLKPFSEGMQAQEAPVNKLDVDDENAVKSVIPSLVPSLPTILSILDKRVKDAGTVDEACAAQEFLDKVKKEFEAIKAREQQHFKGREPLQLVLKEVCPYLDLDTTQHQFDYVPGVEAGDLELVDPWLDELTIFEKDNGLCAYSTPAGILFLTAVSYPNQLSHKHLAGLVMFVLDSKRFERSSVPLLEVVLHVIGRRAEARQEMITAKLTTFTLRAFEFLGAFLRYEEL